MSIQLANTAYQLDNKTNTWSRPDYSTIQYSDGDEIEERLLSILQQTNDLSVLSTELSQQINDWPTRYHLSGIRTNILRPIAASLKGKNVLEIGAGCGAITRFLGESGANIVALEGSNRRASIARERTRDLTNVTVVCDRFNEFNCDQKFDIITLIGVFEYANMFTPGESPAITMLQMVQSLLKPSGKLVIAIENQLGLKYFSGANEDHLNKPFYGIEGRYTTTQPETWGKKKLENILNKAGFSYSKFLAPFPDYKFPTTIVNEEGFVCDDFDISSIVRTISKHDPQLPPSPLFAQELVWPTIVENGLGMDLANSFLVIANKIQDESDVEDPILAYHYSTSRAQQYCKETIFSTTDDNTILVSYNPVEGWGNSSEPSTKLTWNPGEKSDYFLGQNMFDSFIDIVSHDDWSINQVKHLLLKYITILSAELSEAGETTTIDSINTQLPGSFIDLIPQNIIVSNDSSWSTFDQEWVYLDNIPLGWLLFRSLTALCNIVSRFAPSISNIDNSRMGFILAAFESLGFYTDINQLNKYGILEKQLQGSIKGYTADWSWGPAVPIFKLDVYNRLEEQQKSINDLNATIADLRKQTTTDLSLAISQKFKNRKSIQKLLGLKGKISTALSSYTRKTSIIMVVHRDTQLAHHSIDSMIHDIRDTPNTHLIIINDASPENNMGAMLDAQASKLPKKINILTNKQNLGYVKSANIGMKYFNNCDVILISSKVTVPKGWLRILKDEAYSRDNIATITPLSNNVTITSFPNFLQDNKLPFNFDVDEIQTIFNGSKLSNIETPTGADFCIHIRRDCIDKIGVFSEEDRESGKWEINDFCQRAIKAGFVNLITPNLFTHHKKEINSHDERTNLFRNASKTLIAKHPSYQKDLQSFIKANSLILYRTRRFINLLAATPQKKILHITHGIEGDTEQHIDELSSLLDSTMFSVVMRSENSVGSRISIKFGCSEAADKLFFNIPSQYPELLSIFRDMRISGVNYHSLLSLDSVFLNLPSELGIKNIITIHKSSIGGNNSYPANLNNDSSAAYSNNVLLDNNIAETNSFINNAEAVLFPSKSNYDAFVDKSLIKRPIIVSNSVEGKEFTYKGNYLYLFSS